MKFDDFLCSTKLELPAVFDAGAIQVAIILSPTVHRVETEQRAVGKVELKTRAQCIFIALRKRTIAMGGQIRRFDDPLVVKITPDQINPTDPPAVSAPVESSVG